MAKSAELKTRIVEQIKDDWDKPEAGTDYKWLLEEEFGLTDDLFKQVTNVKNWKRTFKERVDVFMMREFSLELDKDQAWALTATVTCDEDDNFLDIEFQVY